MVGFLVGVLCKEPLLVTGRLRRTWGVGVGWDVLSLRCATTSKLTFYVLQMRLPRMSIVANSGSVCFGGNPLWGCFKPNLQGGVRSPSRNSSPAIVKSQHPKPHSQVWVLDSISVQKFVECMSLRKSNQLHGSRKSSRLPPKVPVESHGKALVKHGKHDM